MVVFFCVDANNRKHHHFYTNYEFLVDRRDKHKTFMFIPITFSAPYYSNVLVGAYANYAHAAFLLVDTESNLVV